MRTSWLGGTGLGVLAWLGALAIAHDPAAAQGFGARRMCAQDALRLCADVAPGGGRILRCLAVQERELSDDCRDALRLVAVVRSCRAEINWLCAGVAPGDGRVQACLQGNRDRLSERCRRGLGVLGSSGAGADGPSGWDVEPPDLSEAPIK